MKIVTNSEEKLIKNNKIFQDIEDKIKLVMGEETNVDFEFVDEILPEKSGKYRYTISKVH